ncbi:MAG: capsule biosynthesis protein, partial [Nanoarchaeota archaeon]|nr:capsule biosynthesis protein [Nanoarchaeota archaeon]
LIQYIANKFKQNLKKEYNSVQTKPDFDKKFIYVPLNLQPECSTSPQGNIFVDQILMIETLSASLPSDWIIYVKEHPIQWLRRGLNFFYYLYQGY